MKYTKNKRLIKYLFAIASAVTLMVSMCVMASAEETKNFDSTGFVSCVEGYDDLTATWQLYQEGAIQTFPYYETNGDVRDTSNKRWRTVFNDGRYNRYSVNKNDTLSLIDSLDDPDSDFRYAIDFDQVKSSFDSLGEVTNVRIVYDFSLCAHLVFGTVNGKEYIVPFFTRPDLYPLNNGTAYSSEEVISLIEPQTTSASEKFGGQNFEETDISFISFTELGILPLVIIFGIILVVVVILIIRMNKKQTEMEEDEKQAKIGE